jgi:hypothetical protein
MLKPCVITIQQAKGYIDAYKLATKTNGRDAPNLRGLSRRETRCGCAWRLI